MNEADGASPRVLDGRCLERDVVLVGRARVGSEVSAGYERPGRDEFRVECADARVNRRGCTPGEQEQAQAGLGGVRIRVVNPRGRAVDLRVDDRKLRALPVGVERRDLVADVALVGADEGLESADGVLCQRRLPAADDLLAEDEADLRENPDDGDDHEDFDEREPAHRGGARPPGALCVSKRVFQGLLHLRTTERAQNAGGERTQ